MSNQVHAGAMINNAQMTSHTCSVIDITYQINFKQSECNICLFYTNNTIQIAP